MNIDEVQKQKKEWTTQNNEETLRRMNNIIMEDYNYSS